MRDMRKGTCPVCEHNEIVESEAGEFGHSDAERRMCVTYDARWVMDGRNPRHGHGSLNMYMCRRCGHVQWYADSPADVPVGSEHRTRLITGPDSESPYR